MHIYLDICIYRRLYICACGLRHILQLAVHSSKWNMECMIPFNLVQNFNLVREGFKSAESHWDYICYSQ